MPPWRGSSGAASIEALPAADRRHPYRLTTGRDEDALAAELDRLEALAARGRQRLDRGRG